jgi:FAD-linked sulfhydryl oxidase
MNQKGKSWAEGVTKSDKKEWIPKKEEDCNTCDALGMLQHAQLEVQKSDKPFWEMKAPPDNLQLGNSTWVLLHTMAAYYPETPSLEKKKDTEFFLKSFSKVYPCNYCASDFQEYLTTSPPALENQREFSQWMCKAHNDVNKKLGKPEFDCSLVDQRWKRFVHKP